MNNFETIIGIEIHIELNTKSKMFSSAANSFYDQPNTNVHPIDMGYPGTLPSVNQAAVIKAIKLAKALNMRIDHELHFDRKNYFYPDLPKSFQITQQARPIGSNGFIPLLSDNLQQRVEIERIHLEEDTAKSIHSDSKTLLDYNRAGIPLIEIVTYPTIKSAKEAALYIDSIRLLALTLGISDAKMEEGSLRADINISLRPYGQEKLGTKVEIKNINSISNVQKAIEQEILHQSAAILQGQKVLQTTKRFDEFLQDTFVMRVKRGYADYRYFPEPNIPPIKLTNQFINNIKNPELPWETLTKLRQVNVADEFIYQLINDQDKLNYFNAIEYDDKEKIAKIFFAQIVAMANKKNQSVKELNIDPKELVVAIKKQESGEISGLHLKKIIPLLVNGKKTTRQIIDENKWKQISDMAVLEKMINQILLDNKLFIEQNHHRYERVMKFILGQLMKVSKGQANPVMASELVKKVMGDNNEKKTTNGLLAKG